MHQSPNGAFFGRLPAVTKTPFDQNKLTFCTVVTQFTFINYYRLQPTMKKILLFASLALVPALTFAQGGFQIGIKGGVNLSKLSFGN